MNPAVEDIRAVHLSLCHNQLPHLAEADVIVYDEDAGVVRPGVNFDAVVRVLERVTEGDLPWSDG